MNDDKKRLDRYYNSLECKVKYLTSILEYLLCDDCISLDKHNIAIVMYQIKSIMTLRYRINCMENNKIEGDFDVNNRRVYAFLNGDVEFAVNCRYLNNKGKGRDIPNKTTLLNNFKEEYFKFMLYRHGVVNN